MFVLLALQGQSQFEDWKAKNLLERDKNIIQSRAMWSVKYVPKSGNACAHHLAKWAYHSNYSGPVDLHQLHSLLLEGSLEL